MATPGDVFSCRNGAGAGNVSWVEARDAATHPAMPLAAPTTKNYGAPNISRAKVEIPCPAVSFL